MKHVQPTTNFVNYSATFQSGSKICTEEIINLQKQPGLSDRPIYRGRFKLSQMRSKKIYLMEKLKQILTSFLWNYALVSSVFFVVFIIPFFQQDWQSILYPAFFTIIFFLSVLSIEKRKKQIIVFALIASAFEWISWILDLKYLNIAAQVFTVSFFIIIVVCYISAIAKSKVVNQKVILGSIIGYLLLSIIFGIFIELLVFFDPDAFSYPFTTEAESYFNNKLYYSLVTLSTLGYGDIVPKSPVAKSLATFISGVGQFYIAILVALLVGKFAARNGES